MKDGMQNLIAEVQQEFLSDPDDQLEAMEKASKAFQDSPTHSLTLILRSCHNLKGAAQASGLQNVAAMFHAIETACQALQESISTMSGNFTHHVEKASDLVRSIIIEAKTYFEVLRGLAFGASDPFADHWRSSVQDLLNWTTSLPAASPQTSQTLDVESRNDSMKKAVRSTEIEGFHLFDDEPLTTKFPVAPDAASISDEWGMGSGAQKVVKAAPVGSETKTKSQVNDVPGWGLFEETPPTSAHVSPQLVATPAVTKTPITNTALVNQPVKKPLVTKNQNLSGRYLLFTRLTQSYAVSVNEVKEIVAARPVKPLPMARSGLGGVVTISGIVLPLVEPIDSLGPCSAEGGRYSCMIICGKDENAFALKVDSVSQVVTVEHNQLKEVPDQGGDIRPSCVQGIAEIEGKTVLFIETKGFFAA